MCQTWGPPMRRGGRLSKSIVFSMVPSPVAHRGWLIQ